jgi:putative transposase
MSSGVKKLRHLRKENAGLRKLAADLTLDKEVLSEVVRRKL